MQEPLTVAINAQISLDSPGGTETNLVSLMRAVGETHRDEKFLFINQPAWSQGLLSFTGLDQQFINWPFAQIGYPLPFTFRRPLGEKAKRLRAMAGSLGLGVTLAYWIYRSGRDLYQRLMYERQASFEEVHALLVKLGFRFAGFKNQTQSTRSGQPLQAHCFYIRTADR